MSDATVIVVPARLASQRFPEKLLHPIRGKPLLLWTAERIRAEAPQFPLYFAVDDERLASPLRERGFECVMTRPDHASGTDRIAEANAVIQAGAVINVQADEPLVTGKQIRDLARLLGGGAAMATLAIRFTSREAFLNTNQVKVVISQHGRALYFSRGPIPFDRDRGTAIDDEWVRSHDCYRHLGMYAYDAAFLRSFTSLKAGRLEKLERLEQLRALENHFEIAVGITEEPTVGIDAPEDVTEFEAYLDGVGGKFPTNKE
jgi:3-deoxy-manno-octulosonate cytidylyltransferase (CMP-KDO synthetase)